MAAALLSRGGPTALPEEHPETELATVPRRYRAWMQMARRSRVGWLEREPRRHDSYVSNVTNPDDRRFIPRR